jgi:phage-related protein
LHLLQNGEDPDDWKSIKGVGSGVREVRLHTDGEHRIIYVAKFEEGIYVLHSFQKKSQKTAKSDLEIVKERFRLLVSERVKH